jgi:hypothetical protein
MMLFATEIKTRFTGATPIVVDQVLAFVACTSDVKRLAQLRVNAVVRGAATVVSAIDERLRALGPATIDATRQNGRRGSPRSS